MNRFYLKSFGCKVNQYDGQHLRERLIRAGYTEIPEPEGADLLVVNFCVVTGRAASRGLRALKNLARRNSGARILLSGCLSPEDRDRLHETFPQAVFSGPGGSGAAGDFAPDPIGTDPTDDFGEVRGL
ncbi:MAG: hypothetical protein KJ645_13990 [Planctomycetes bacterium]|nr:hypothetical protein [Planctomycetota bacterium]